jgi:carnitine O-acetyltransferase
MLAMQQQVVHHGPLRLLRRGRHRRHTERVLLRLGTHLASSSTRSSSSSSGRDMSQPNPPATVPLFNWDAIYPPPLPLPPLQDTAARYIEQLRPLLSPTQIREAEQAVGEFIRGGGRALQAQLAAGTATAEGLPRTSYVKRHWDKMYLGGRYPVPINSNPFVYWHPHPDPELRSQARRAAVLVHRMLKWRQGMCVDTAAVASPCAAVAHSRSLRRHRGSVEPDGSPEKRLCMQEYKKLFGTTRIPVAKVPLRTGAGGLCCDQPVAWMILVRTT